MRELAVLATIGVVGISLIGLEGGSHVKFKGPILGLAMLVAALPSASALATGPDQPHLPGCGRGLSTAMDRIIATHARERGRYGGNIEAPVPMGMVRAVMNSSECVNRFHDRMVRRASR